MERRRQKSVIKRNAINFTKIVSLVGIRHATDSQNSLLRRIVWICWLLFGAGFALQQIIERTTEYTKYLLSPEVYFITDKDNLSFPQVTLCNDNPTPNAEGQVKRFLVEIQQEYNNMKEHEKKSENTKRDLSENKLKELLEKLSNETSQWEQLSKNFSLTLKDAVVESTFDHRSVEGQEVITSQGHCYAFSTKNKNSSLYSTKGGSSNGLYLVLKVGSGEPATGYKMLIHDPYEDPRMKEATTVISLGAQTLTKVAITFEHVHYEGPPYYKCNDTDEYYRLSNCLAGCDNEVFKTRCKCRDIHMEADGIFPVCSYGKILNCSTYFVSSITNSSDLKGCDCDPECNTFMYKTSVTQLPASSQVSDSDKRKKVYVSVFYPSITYTMADNVADYLFLDLLGDIGGALSLLLGATILTVYEVCEFVILVVKDYFLFKFFK